jgi:thymidylate synthase (FAD)
MEIKLIQHSSLSTCVQAIRKCWNSQDKGGCYTTPTDDITEKDKELIHRVGNKNKHKSTLEFLDYVFDINDISTKTLLGLTRHRVGNSFAVQSTRYTTKKRRGHLSTIKTDNEDINGMLEEIMDIVDVAIQKGYSNDDISLLLPQGYNYSLVCKMNARSLQGFLGLRTSPSAHYEIRELAYAMYNALPDEHTYLFSDYINE